MAELNEFYLDASPSAVMLECVEISHSLWSQPLRYVLNHTDGVTVIHENGESAFYTFMPLQIKKGGAANDLDQSISVTVGDLGEHVPSLLKMLEDADSRERPVLIYRAYSSEDLNDPLWVINGLFVDDESSDYQGTTFRAATSKANSNGTGMRYTVDEFPSLKAFF
ncbi:DUF1833 family protein [Acinetobacter sp. WCHAc010052]|uniref:DUF1833 family protein n=1 Tax=Acinetobacter sp. WCHAc010052 TaxID=2004647 RepID=UPI000B3BEBDD|nr:DUF1833 family protein [Acinetobacter sp. WCHAc010052]AXY60032.1 DUF1833 domain-containing protein [Acinetobacter sp. WCHAc010052]